MSQLADFVKVGLAVLAFLRLGMPVTVTLTTSPEATTLNTSTQCD